MDDKFSYIPNDDIQNYHVDMIHVIESIYNYLDVAPDFHLL